MLQVVGVVAGYEHRPVLRRVSLEVRRGEIVALLGPNGAGKSTLLRAVFGLVRVAEGRVMLGGVEITKRRASERLEAGIVYLPQGGRVFENLTVAENLELGGYVIRDGGARAQRFEEVVRTFPILTGYLHKPARVLSSGTKQMLALARALMVRPRVLLMDEPSLGLAPEVAAATIRRIDEVRAQFSVAVLLVEQNIREALAVADRLYGMRLGRIVLHDTPAGIGGPSGLRSLFLASR